MAATIISEIGVGTVRDAAICAGDEHGVDDVNHTVVGDNVGLDNLGGLITRHVRDLDSATAVGDCDVAALLGGQVEGTVEGSQVARVVNTVNDVV